MAEPPERVADVGAAPDQPGSRIGFKLDWLGGGSGRVEGVLVDSRGEGPRWLVIRRARFGRRTAVPYELAVAGEGRVWVPFSREAIRSAPEVDPAAGLDLGGESELCKHYGIPPGARRWAELEGRSSEDLTSVQAPGALDE